MKHIIRGVNELGNTVIYDEKDVRLEALRLQSPTTYKEQIRIDIYIEGKQRGKIVCSVLELEKDLQRLREYGTGLLRHDIIKIRTEIDKNYSSIDHISLEALESMEDEVKGIYDMVCSYISENMEIMEHNGFIEPTYYNIPVADFNRLIQGSIFSDCDLTMVRTRFVQLGFTKGNRGRTDKNVRIKIEKGKQSDQNNTNEQIIEKIIKVISFERKKVDDRTKELPKEV